MKKKEFENVPIRSLENILSKQEVSKFEIGLLKPEKNNDKIIIEPHRHDYYHIMFVKNGVGEHIIDFKTYEIIPNSIFFVSPGQVHSLEISSEAEGYVISFNSDFYLLNDSLEKLLNFPFFHSLSNAPVVYLPENSTKVKELWEELYEEYTTDLKDKNNILRALLEVLLIRISRLYIQPIKNEEKTSNLTYQLRKLETLIDTHYKEYRLLNDYANLMHVSPVHLTSLCKKGLNKTVKNLIHERLLIEAKRLLLFTNNSITEIAFELGFADKSYFMRFFKKQTSYTADSYRNLNKKAWLF